MSTTEARPTLPDWFNLDDVIAPERRQVLEEQVRTVAETIVSAREVFEVARAHLAMADNAIGGLPTELFELVSDYTALNQLYVLLHAFAEVVSPDSTLDGLHTRVERLDAELAKVPGLR